MGAKFHAAANLPIAFDYSSFLATLTYIIKANGLLVLTDDTDGPVGMIGVVITPSFYNRNILTAIEAFWWVEPEYRGRGGKMIDALEERAQQIGAVSLDFASKSAFKSVGRLYERKGYKLTTNNYIKVF